MSGEAGQEPPPQTDGHEPFAKQPVSRNYFVENQAYRSKLELLNAGLSLDASLRTMKQNSQKPAFKQFTGEIERKLKEGKSFSEALAQINAKYTYMERPRGRPSDQVRAARRLGP